MIASCSSPRLRRAPLLVATGLLAGGAVLPAPALAQRPRNAAPQVDTALYATLDWRLVGPFRGGRSVAVAGVAGQPRTYFFGGVGGGVWKTTDAGQAWTNVSDGQIQTASVGAIAVAPSDPNVVYVGMGEHAPRGVTTSHGDGVYRSTDAGRTWTHLGLDDTRAISRIVVHPTNPDVVYVAAQGAPYGASEERGIYRSRDGGATWQKVHYVSETSGASELSMDPTNPRILYAAFWDHVREPWEVRSGGPGSGLWKSTDAGETWTKLENGLPDLMGKIGVSVSGANPDVVYAIIEAEPDGGVFRSDDAGQSWRRVNSVRGLRSRPWYYMEIFADPSDENTVYALNAPFWKSIDGGRTFQSISVGHGDTHDLWINPDDPDNLILADDGGAEVTFNGGTSWSSIYNQPTAQFYRVNADNRVPYWIYGGQQDNSSVAIKSRDFDGSIGPEDYRSSAGCESAWVAFDPDNPRFQYGGCYLGQINEVDDLLQTSRNVQVRPGMPASIQPKDMLYRFNWNAPIVVSPFDGNVLYHGGNHLLMSSDRGNSWEEISPDLTRDEESKQGPGGTPITNEGAGGEVYGTIYTISPSPVDRDVIWTGSDDGLVQVTRDGGATWTNVTPALPEAMINAVEASPHEAGAAYIAVTRYKFNDFTPMAYKTTDFGRTWTAIADGIPADHWVRVIREDTERRGLLYLGTELGMFVSFDDGAHWQSLQLDLPLTPITDLKVHQGDLLAATQGRAFWVLDDLGPLRQLHAERQAVAAAPVWLFAPSAVYRQFGGGGGFGGGAADAASNPPGGAQVHFKVAEFALSAEEAAAPVVTLEFLDAQGAVIRTYSSRPGEGPGAPTRLQVEPGMNRMGWNLRHESVPNVEGLYTFGSLAGRMVPPGEYRVRLTVEGQETIERAFQVRDVPQVAAEITAADHQARDRLTAQVRTELEALHGSVSTLQSVSGQLDDAVERTGEHPRHDTIQAAARMLEDSIQAVDSMLVNRNWTTGQDPTVFPTRLNQFFIYLRSAIDGMPGAPTQGMLDQFRELTEEWRTYRSRIDWILGPGVGAFNQLLESLGVQAVEVGGRRPVS
ncbi:MAG: glycosyl hydrolase [Gemmatimonadota bacterium]